MPQRLAAVQTCIAGITHGTVVAENVNFPTALQTRLEQADRCSSTVGWPVLAAADAARGVQLGHQFGTRACLRGPGPLDVGTCCGNRRAGRLRRINQRQQQRVALLGPPLGQLTQTALVR